jgi:hypothetical protein
MIAIFTYIHQLEKELEQRATEAQDRRVREMKGAVDFMERGDRTAGIFQLSLFGKDAIPLIMGEVRVNNFHIDWPSTTLAALVSLQRIGIHNLAPEDIQFLRQQGDVAVDKIRSLSPNMSVRQREDAYGLVRIVNSIQGITGPDRNWSDAIRQFQKDYPRQPRPSASPPG